MTHEAQRRHDIDAQDTARWAAHHHILAPRYQGSVMEVFHNGRLLYKRSVSTNGPWTLNRIGALYSLHFMVDDIAEPLIYPDSLLGTALAQTTAAPDISPEHLGVESPARR